MKARLKVYDVDGTTAKTANVGAGAGILPTSGLQFSVEVGGGGGIQFDALQTDLDSLNARDSVAVVELQTDDDPVTWTAVAAYALRGEFRRQKVGGPLTTCTGVALLEQWASECLIFPEYATFYMPRGAGTDRAIGWQSTAYNPSADANEAWTGCYETARSAMPGTSVETGEAWPTGTGATWISITGASDEAERKLFRTAQASPLTIATAGPIRCYAASDSRGTLYVAGEPVLVVDGGEPGREPAYFQQVDMFMEPGDYACAFDTESIWDTGGDGVDPIIVAICTLDADGDPDSWLLVTNETDWVACRRDAEPPDNDPPGPTPGQTIGLLLAEAQARNVSGWANVTAGFTADEGSDEDTWDTVVIERLVRYGSDTLWSVFRMLSETGECDTWMGPDLVLHAANRQGAADAASFYSPGDIVTMSDTYSPDMGTYAAGLALDGWTDSLTLNVPRREYGMEVGTAITRAVALRVVESALAENGRWDGSMRLSPTAPTPLVDFQVGDTVAILDQPGSPPGSVRVLSVSASAGDGGLLWDLELGEVGQ